MQKQEQLPLGNYANVDVGALSASDRSDILMLAERVAVYGAKHREVLSSPAHAKLFVSAQLRGHTKEVFLVVFLNSQHEVLASEEMFQGSLDACHVYPREIVKRALELNAGAVLLSHPHPSGEPEPSSADRQITKRISAALELVDVRVLDHLVVGANSGKPPVSFAERGWL